MVGEAGSAEDAFNLLADTNPDVILMDIDMPGVGGVAAVAALAQAQDQINDVLGECRIQWCWMQQKAVPFGAIDHVRQHLQISSSSQFAALHPTLQECDKRLPARHNEQTLKVLRKVRVQLCFRR